MEEVKNLSRVPNKITSRKVKADKLRKVKAIINPIRKQVRQMRREIKKATLNRMPSKITSRLARIRARKSPVVTAKVAKVETKMFLKVNLVTKKAKGNLEFKVKIALKANLAVKMAKVEVKQAKKGKLVRALVIKEVRKVKMVINPNRI